MFLVHIYSFVSRELAKKIFFINFMFIGKFLLLNSRYTLSIFFKGRKKTLDTKDLYRALKEHKSGNY